MSREVSQGKQYQGEDESIAYTIDVTNWGSSPSSVSMAVYDVTNGRTDVSVDVVSGSTSVSGNVITLKTISGLTLGYMYRVEVQFTISGNVFEAWFSIECQR